jgi:hypothetical protein
MKSIKSRLTERASSDWIDYILKLNGSVLNEKHSLKRQNLCYELLLRIYFSHLSKLYIFCINYGSKIFPAFNLWTAENPNSYVIQSI